jgi:hypothetical protein
MLVEKGYRLKDRLKENRIALGMDIYHLKKNRKRYLNNVIVTGNKLRSPLYKKKGSVVLD